MGDREPRPLSGLRLHNTLTGKDEPFPPARVLRTDSGVTPDVLSSVGAGLAPAPSDILIYVCGITPYDECHLGHARCYVTFDVLRRHLRFLGHRVRFVQNFTDIDDKIIARGAELGIAPAEVAARYSAAYFEVMDRLNVERADLYPKVTESIPDIIRLIERLVAAGLAYAAGGDVWYAVRKFPGYGKLSHRKIGDLQSGSRVEPSEAKRDPLDFALWKAAKPGEPSWESPWGAGRPGWHIECSAMAMRHLGETIDLHGGGQDLIFPHHENEIAQSEGATGRPFARHWAHNGFVNISGEKMAKSLGNFVTLRELCARENPDVVRYLLVSHHYRGPLDYTPDRLTEARKGFARLARAVEYADSVKPHAGDLPESIRQTLQALQDEFVAALNDDLNTARALATLHALFNLMDQLTRGVRGAAAGLVAAGAMMRRLAGILGLAFPRRADDPKIESLIKERDAARARKDWAESDRLRADLAARGIDLEDTPLGTRWRRPS